ncbi:MAG: hypothetical protein IPO05_09675 [Flavobacteriales bacterium]|nr:hypothetical protein [Flavobacteriales bacterium]
MSGLAASGAGSALRTDFVAFCDGRSGAAFGVCLGSLFEGVRSVVLRTFFAGVEVLAARLVDIGSFTGACFFGGGVDFGVLAGARLAGPSSRGCSSWRRSSW